MVGQPTSRAGGQEYSLFKDVSGGAAVWGAAGDNHHNVEPPPPQVTHFNMVTFVSSSLLIILFFVGIFALLLTYLDMIRKSKLDLKV